MKKKTIKQQSELARSTTLAENQEWHQRILEERFNQASKQSKKNSSTLFRKKVFWIPLCSSIAVMCIIALSIWIFYPSSANTPSKRYLTENQSILEIESLENANDIKDVAIRIDNIYTQSINKVYDSESNDTLFYIVELSNDDETYENIIIYIYTNKYFQDRKTLHDATETKIISNLSIQYSRNIIVDDWANEITYTATIACKDTEIYINYRQYSIDETSNFFNFLEQTIVSKA